MKVCCTKSGLNIYIYYSIDNYYVPIAIGLLDKIKNPSFYLLDKKIVNYNFFNVPKIIIIVASIFITLFFWQDITSCIVYVNGVLVLILIIFIVLLIDNIVNIYNFDINGEDINGYRLNAIKKLEISEKNKAIWYEILNSDFKNDVNFFKDTINIFFDKVIAHIESTNSINISLLSNLFFKYSTIEEDIVTNAFFEYEDGNLYKCLKLYNYTSGTAYKDNAMVSSSIRNSIHGILKRQIKSISIIENDYKIYSFNHILKSHIKDFKNIEGYESEMLSFLLNIILNDDTIINSRSFIKDFPYKFNIKTYKADETNLDHIIFSNSMNYFIKIIQKNNFDDSEQVNLDDNVLRYWFCDFEILTFSAFLHFVYTPYGENRILSVLEAKRKMGFLSRVKICGGNIDDDYLKTEYEKEYTETIQNISKIFQIDIKTLSNWIKELNKIHKDKDKDNSIDKIRDKAKHYEMIFKDIKKEKSNLKK